MNEAALRSMYSIDAILVDKALMMIRLENLQKRFPKNHVCPKCLAAPSQRLGDTKECRNIHSRYWMRWE